MPSSFQSFTRTSEPSSTSRRTTASTAPIAAGVPFSTPSVSAGATRPCALVTVVVRAFAIASRSPTRRLAIAVAIPTMTSAITPASAKRPTSNATKRRLDSSVPRDRVMCGDRRGGSRASPRGPIRGGRDSPGSALSEGSCLDGGASDTCLSGGCVPRGGYERVASRRGWSRGRGPRRIHSARRSLRSASAQLCRCR